MKYIRLHIAPNYPISWGNFSYANSLSKSLSFSTKFTSNANGNIVDDRGIEILYQANGKSQLPIRLYSQILGSYVNPATHFSNVNTANIHYCKNLPMTISSGVMTHYYRNSYGAFTYLKFDEEQYNDYGEIDNISPTHYRINFDSIIKQHGISLINSVSGISSFTSGIVSKSYLAIFYLDKSNLELSNELDYHIFGTADTNVTSPLYYSLLISFNNLFFSTGFDDQNNPYALYGNASFNIYLEHKLYVSKNKAYFIVKDVSNELICSVNINQNYYAIPCYFFSGVQNNQLVSDNITVSGTNLITHFKVLEP